MAMAMARCSLWDSEDMIIEIFRRLPSKSLLRFTLISKSYSSLISTPEFIRVHALRCPPKILIIFTQRSSANCRSMARNSLYGPYKEFYTLHSEHQLPLSREFGFRSIIGVNFPFPNFHIVGSCNGIFCLQSYDSSVVEFVLWNPSIRRKLTLPPINHHSNFNVSRFNVSEFGYDPITYDYKVLRMSSDSRSFQNQVVYSVNTGAWVEIPPPSYPYFRVDHYSCFVNGVIHWCASNHQCWFIMTFDVSSHVFGEIALPDEIRNYINLKPIIIRERLAVVAGVINECVIWMMREYNNASTWSPVCEFKCHNRDVELQGCLQINGDFLLKRKDGEGFEIVNPMTGAFYRLVDLGVNFMVNEAVTFKESLALLNEGVHYQGQGRQFIGLPPLTV